MWDKKITPGLAGEFRHTLWIAHMVCAKSSESLRDYFDTESETVKL